MILSRGRQAWGASFPHGRMFAWSLALCLFLGGAASADIYEGSVFPSPLVLVGGSITFDTDNLVTVPGTVAGDLDDGVAVFRYSDVEVGAGVTVTVIGSRPLAITSSGDMVWEADIDASGDVPGRAGGGLGGAGGAGGASGGVGGAGGTVGAGVGIGGGAAAGGRGGLRDGNASLDGEPGGNRSSGTSGVTGLGGTAGADGAAGGNGALGGGTTGAATGVAGSGGGAGDGGAASAAPNNAGLGGVASGGGGNAGGSIQNATGQAGDPGGSPGVAGSPASAGADGGDGTDGDDGTDATFTTPANTLALAGGTGGGGGGGGGKGGGGQGGGSGGGGSSGAGAGGGGAMEAVNECGVNPVTNGLGGNGRAGGAGGNGGTGGDGGTSVPGADGTDGGSGGGAVLLATRGLLQFGASVDVSAGTPAVAGGPSVGVAGAAAGAFGSGAGSPAATAANNGTSGSWSFLQGIYCTGVGSANGGAGGAGTGGGNGGAGGAGGFSGESGGGGNGGLGTPGMVKLHGSVVLAGTGTVVAGGNGGSANPDQNGKFTFISNMSAAAIAANQPVLTNANTVSAAITNDPLLTAPAPYDPGLDIPVIPQLLDGPDSSGILPGAFYNDSLVLPLLSGVDPIELAVLPNASTVFDGYDQLLVQNNTGAVAVGVQVVISGFGAVTLPDLADGEIWTTLIPAGTSVGSVTPIAFTTQPTSVDVYVGEPVTLTVVATGGNGALEYQWRRNGVDLPGEEASTLNIAAASLADNGFYDCVVSDTGAPPAPSAISATAEVGVFEHLQITQQPEGGVRFTNPPSNFAVFVGVTGGLRSVDFEWRLDGSPIVGAPNSPVYFINPVQEADGGEYSVLVTDLGTDSELSQAALLEVNPLGFTQQPISLTVLEPDSATFSVAIEGGRTLDGLVTITYQWFKVDDSKADELIVGADSDTLVIDPTSVADAGGYYCQVTDAVGPLNSAVGNLSVLTSLGALSIVQQPQPLTVSEGDTAVFTVAVVGGTGPLTYIWKRNGVAIVGAPNSPVLTVPGASTTDAGDYSVDVSDDDTTVASDDAALVVDEAGLPLAGPLGLAVVAGAVLAAGALRFRRRK